MGASEWISVVAVVLGVVVPLGLFSWERRARRAADEVEAERRREDIAREVADRREDIARIELRQGEENLRRAAGVVVDVVTTPPLPTEVRLHNQSGAPIFDVQLIHYPTRAGLPVERLVELLADYVNGRADITPYAEFIGRSGEVSQGGRMGAKYDEESIDGTPTLLVVWHDGGRWWLRIPALSRPPVLLG